MQENEPGTLAFEVYEEESGEGVKVFMFER